MSEIDLVDCPFCGSDEITVEKAKKDWYSAICGNCEAEGPPAYSHKDARLAWKGRATPPSPSTAPMCERKTAKLEEEGYAKTGYVLRQPGKDREVVVSDGGAVSWFTTEQWNWLMFNRDHVEFQWPKPIAALASRPAEVDDDPPQWWHELQAAAEALDDAGAPLNAESVRKIAEQYRQGQRDAVAADRARRGGQL